MINLNDWAESQTKTLISLGFDAADAEASVTWTLDNMPLGADPRTWVPSATQLDQRITDADVHDARVAWYASDSVPPKFKRLLDARNE